MAARIAELEDMAEQARNRAAKLEKDKNKLTIEIRDISIQLEAVSLCEFFYIARACPPTQTICRWQII